VKLLTVDERVRARYADILRHFPGATVYHTPQWLGVWEALGADLEFIEIDSDTIMPFVAKGSGMLRRAFSLPFDTYGGPVSASGTGPVTFERVIEPLATSSVRVADFAAGVVSLNGALQPVASHIVDLSAGYERAAERYADANRRNIRQAGERGVSIVSLSGADAAREFHRLHVGTMARFGTRPMSRRFFEAIMERLVPLDLATFTFARHDERLIAGNLVLRYRDRSYDWMWVYDNRATEVRATNLLIDRALHDEAARGSREINLGASPNDSLGSVRFKQSFGARPFGYSVFTHTSRVVSAARRARRSVERAGARVRTRFTR
jgi:hypothetical protein